MHVCVHKSRLYMGNLRKSELTDGLTTNVSKAVCHNPDDHVAK